MTVSSTTNRKSFTGDAVTTSFGTSPVVFFNTSELVVQVVTTATGAATTLVENTDFTVTGGSGSTGTVNLAGGTSPNGAPASTETLVILRVLPLTQTDDFVNNDINDAEVTEDRLDKITMMIQQLDEVDDRTLRLSSSETATTALTELPFDRASKFLAFNASKELIASAGTTETPVSAFMATVLDDATAADARTTLGAASTASPTFTGVASFPDGTAAAPSVKVGDEQNGFFSPGANIVSAASGGVESARFNTAASAVDYVALTPAAAGNRPTIAAAGASTNITLGIEGKGTGSVGFISNGAFAFLVNGVASTVNRIETTAAATGNAPQFIAAGSDTNVGIRLTPKGTGGLLIGQSSAATGFENASDITMAATNAIKSRSTFSAWVRHTDAAAIQRALNVGSVTKNSTGNFTANITASVMADGSYGFFGMATNSLVVGQDTTATPTATAFKYQVVLCNTAGATDPAWVTVGLAP